eukprot:407791_1
MDANTGLVTVSTDLMPYPIAYTSPIIVDTVLYTFGGVRDAETEGNLIRNWQYYDLATVSPTRRPSVGPTKSPSKSPTKSPIKSPTHTSTTTSPPTKSPTDAPFVPLSIPHDTLPPTSQPTSPPTHTVLLASLTQESDTESQRSNDTSSSLMPVLISLTGSVLLVCVCILLSIIWYFCRQLKGNSNQ